MINYSMSKWRRGPDRASTIYKNQTRNGCHPLTVILAFDGLGASPLVQYLTFDREDNGHYLIGVLGSVLDDEDIR